jgi:hypothetical protein
MKKKVMVFGFRLFLIVKYILMQYCMDKPANIRLAKNREWQGTNTLAYFDPYP